MTKFVDIHTHNDSFINDQISMQVIEDFSIIKDNYFCYGLHPWNIDKYEIDTILKNLSQIIFNKKFLALGEIGLDKKIGNNFIKQKMFFEQQIIFAIKHEIKWIIIHCVKAYNEIYEILSRCKYNGSILFHGFNSSSQIIKQFEKFDCYYSFGHMLITNEKNQKTFKELNNQYIFLETDDQSKYSIEDIYDVAAKIKGIKKSDLKDQMERKFNKLFIESN